MNKMTVFYRFWLLFFLFKCLFLICCDVRTFLVIKVKSNQNQFFVYKLVFFSSSCKVRCSMFSSASFFNLTSFFLHHLTMTFTHY